MKKTCKLLVAMICVGLVTILCTQFVFGAKPPGDTRLTRTVEVGVDHMAMLRQNVDSYILEATDTSVSLEAEKSFPMEMFSRIEKLSLGSLYGQDLQTVFDVYFDLEHNLIFLNAEIIAFNEVLARKAFLGSAFYGAGGQVDVKFNIDGQYILRARYWKGVQSKKSSFLPH